MESKESFFSEEQKHNFQAAVTMLFVGFALLMGASFLIERLPQGVVYNIALAFGWVGWGLIFASIGFATWKFRGGLYPFCDINKEEGA
jgi:hypothetical protein